MKNNRLSQPYGTLVNQEKTISFAFEGKTYQGFEGDSIASALWANDEKMISRSFKYHRPRGILSMTGQDANTLVQLPEEGNVAADNYRITEGLKVKGQHYIGSLKNDRLSIVAKLSRFLPVGFYYKAFYKGNSWNNIWGKFFRKLTGLGVIGVNNDQKEYDKKYLFYDVVVVGAGMAGLQTALNLAKSGVEDILLVDEHTQLGGALNFARCSAQMTQDRQQWIDAVEAHPNITAMTETTCNGVYSDNWLALIQGQRLFKTRCKQLIFCTGCFEQPLIFHNNDIPGIMLSTAAQKLMKQYGVKPGEKAVVATSHRDGYEVALDLLEAGVEVAYLIDLKPFDHPLVAEVENRGIKVLSNHAVYSAQAGSNKTKLAKITVKALSEQGECTGAPIEIDCDLLCMCGGYMPAYQLPCFLGASLNYDQVNHQFLIEKLAKDNHLVGSIGNAYQWQDVQVQSAYVAEQVKALLQTGKPSDAIAPQLSASPDFVAPIVAHPEAKEFIDYDEDLQVCDVINAVREGYHDIQLVKRFSTLGMGPSQGRFTAMMSASLVASLDKNRTIGKVGVTTARPPYTVEKIGHMAGRSFFPERHSSMHHRHKEMGAQMMIAGAWLRPAYYGPKGQVLEHIASESQHVRRKVGIIDVSTLGGIEVRGADAAEFMHRMYTWNFLKQPVGKARYALLTNEAGIVIDDGVACRFGDQHFYVTATTGGVDNVYLQFLKWNARWRLDVDIANVTSSWCGVNIAGPDSRKVLETVCKDVDLSAEAFPYIGIREGTVAGIQARLIRVGFVGELGYEIHVPQHQGEALWDALIEAGKPFDIKPFGVETQRLLRLEKAHVIISQDTDSTTYPEEINMSWAVGKKKPFFVGQKSIDIVNEAKPVRKLIGFSVVNSSAIPKENHLCFDNDNKLIGRVTSCLPSATLGKTIGMAYVEPDCTEIGSLFKIRCDHKQIAPAIVLEMPFYDPENLRQEM